MIRDEGEIINQLVLNYYEVNYLFLSIWSQNNVVFFPNKDINVSEILLKWWIYFFLISVMDSDLKIETSPTGDPHFTFIRANSTGSLAAGCASSASSAHNTG